MSVWRLFLVFASTLVLVSCGGSSDDGGNQQVANFGGTPAAMMPPQSAENPPATTTMNEPNQAANMPAPIKTIEASPGEFSIPPLDPGRSHESTIILTNTGNTRVQVTKVTLDNPTGGRIDVLYSATGRVGIDQDGNDKFAYPVSVDTDRPLQLRVYVVQGATGQPGGTLTVTGDFESSPLRLPIKSVAGLGAVELSRSSIDFGRVRPANPSFEALTGITGEKTEVVTVTNGGLMPLKIRNLELKKGGSGAESLDFSVTIAGVDPIDDPTIYADPDQDGTPGLRPGGQFDLTVTYRPSREGTDRARILIDSDDPVNPEVDLQLLGNETQGCIEVNPLMVALDTMLGTAATSGPISVANCGTTPLTIDYLGFAAGTDGSIFTLSNPNFNVFPAEMPANGEPIEVTVGYNPNTGTISSGNLLIMSNDPAMDKNLIIVRISGTAPCASDEDCAMGQACGNDQRCFTPEMME
ncbi:MAG: choice-of-anchor D domain-containing protein [Myxococcota bacterium]|nr:choice-of-anchor D domain-containing protein [Myxococcota bacterium]